MCVGGVLGYTLGLVNQNLEKQAATMPNKPPTMTTGSFSGPPKALALNLAVFTAVQAGLTLAVKRYRGVDDVQTNMIGMFGAGASSAAEQETAVPAERNNRTMVS